MGIRFLNMSGQFIFSIWLLLSIYINPFRSIAQEYSWRHYSIGDGLPQTQVYSLYQDYKGYIWIGTKGGLSRFDGIEFKNFKFDDGFDGEFIWEIRGDNDSGIFIISRNIIRYYKHGSFSMVTAEDPVTNYINCFSDRNNNLILLKNDTIRVYDDERQPFNLPVLDNYLEKFQGFFRDLYMNDRTNDIYFFLKDNSMYRWNGQELDNIWTGNKLIYPSMGMDGELYAYDQDSLYVFDHDKFSPFLCISGFEVRKVVSRNEIYFTNAENFTRLYLYDGEIITRFHQRFNVVIRVMKDDESNLWVGTESGLWLLQNKGFQNFLTDKNDNFYTWSVSEDRNGNILFGSFLHGLKKYDGNDFSIIPIDHAFLNKSWQYFYSGSCKDESGDILFSTYEGIMKYDGRHLSRFYDGSSGAVLFIYPDIESGHYLTLTAYDGLVEIDKNGILVQKENRKPQENTGLETSVLRDKYGRVWLSGKQGISIKEGATWRNLPDESDSIPIGAISMLKDHFGNLWLGSNDGIYHYDYKKLTKVAGHYFNNQVGVLNMTDQNELFIGSISGIGLLSLDAFYGTGTEKLRYFDQNSGFLGKECKHNASFKDSNGNIWVCTSDRVVKISPKALRSDTKPPRVYIQGISVPSATMEWVPVYNVHGSDEVYPIAREYEDIRFDYHAISHTAPQGVHYQTMLQGYDTDWSAATYERYRTYTNMKPGKYTFRVKAATIDGVWNEQPASITIELLPEWYELASVRTAGLIAMVLLATLSGFVYSERLRKKRLASEENAKEMARLQLNALKKLIDPHFTFNAINSIAAMVYREQRDDAYQYFTKFSRLIRLGFETSDEVIRSIREELDFVTSYLELEKLRFRERFNYCIRVGEGVNQDWKIPKMIIQIYVENSIKHGFSGIESGGLVEVDLDAVGDNLRITIRDNGVGRKNKNQHKNDSLGKGTSIIDNYLRLINEYNQSKIKLETTDLVNSDGRAGGVEVMIMIPIQFKYG